MKRVRYDPTCVQAISEDGLRYIDDQGQSHLIDFAQCRNNWVRFVNESAEFSTTTLSEDESRCVAWRNAAHDPPYIEFFTEPRIRFEFGTTPSRIARILRYSTMRQQQHFSQLQQAIYQAGWTWYDRS